MSRNRERTGGAHQQNATPPPQAIQNAGGEREFAFVIPTEFVDLPSGGRFYREGHPLHGETSIEIKQMTAKEEDILTSRSLLKKGVALDRLIKSLIVDKRIDSNSLLVGDRNAILIAARISGYGPEYETKVTCPACETSQEYGFNLADAHVYDGGLLVPEQAVNNEDGTFTTTLPRTKLEITFRLLNGRDEKNLLLQLESSRKSRKEETTVTSQLKQIIVAVNGTDDQDAINYLVTNMPSMDARWLRVVYKAATPNVDLTQNFECNDCDYDQAMEVPLTADFFWPDR